MRGAIVGSGLAALAAYATLRHGGIDAGRDRRVRDGRGPDRRLARRAAGIRQRTDAFRVRRALPPASFPGLAVREVARRGSVRPLLQTSASRYHPRVDEFLAHAGALPSGAAGRAASSRGGSSGCARSTAASSSTARAVRARAARAGHPGLRVPRSCAGSARRARVRAARVRIEGGRRRRRHGRGDRVAERTRRGRRGRLDPPPRADPPPAERPAAYFSQRGLAAYHRLDGYERAAMLEELAQPSYPPGAAWDEPLRRRRSRGDSASSRASSSDEYPVPGHLRDGVQARVPARPAARPWSTHGLETHGRWIVLDPDSTVPALTDRARTLTLAGGPAQWAYPAADTIAGAKYAARGFLRRVRRCRTR